MNFLPMPQKVVHENGLFILSYRSVIVLTDTKPSALLYAGLLRDTITEETGLTLSILRGVSRPGDISLSEDATLPTDRYQMLVSEHGIYLRGGSDAALCHGVQTLRQWIQRHGFRLPALKIEDWPDFPNRGYYLDVSRGRVPTLTTLKEYADLLCRYKINQWQLYVEHTYLFRDFSESWRDDTPLTAEEIMELDAYCAARCIELVPSLSTFGHMYKILSTKSNHDLCEMENPESYPHNFSNVMHHHTLNVSNERALPFVFSMIDEYMQLFTSRKFNICADETFDLGKGRSAELAQKIGERSLYMNHVKALCEHLVAQGRTPQFWGDIVVRFKDAYDILPKETVCLNWGYLPNQPEYEIQALAEAGATQYVCPAVWGWNRLIPLIRDSFDNIRAMCAHGQKYGAIGLLNTDWGDFGHINHPWLSVPGILYGAALSWNNRSNVFDVLNRAISFLEYGDKSEQFMEAFRALSCHEIFDWYHAVLWIEADDDLQRKEIFSEIRVEEAPAANRALEEALGKLREAARSMPHHKRSCMHALCLMADGVRIWNDIAVHIGHVFYGQGSKRKEGTDLACELEAWYHAYAQQWRSVSKEGGIARIMTVVNAYADLLRG